LDGPTWCVSRGQEKQKQQANNLKRLAVFHTDDDKSCAKSSKARVAGSEGHSGSRHNKTTQNQAGIEKTKATSCCLPTTNKTPRVNRWLWLGRRRVSVGACDPDVGRDGPAYLGIVFKLSNPWFLVEKWIAVAVTVAKPLQYSHWRIDTTPRASGTRKSWK